MDWEACWIMFCWVMAAVSEAKSVSRIRLVALVPDGGFETVLHSTQLGTLAVDGGDKFIDVTQRILGCFGRGYIERGIGSGGPLLQEAILARIARAVSLKIFGKAQIIGKCHIGHAETKLVSTVGDAALQAQLNTAEPADRPEVATTVDFSPVRRR